MRSFKIVSIMRSGKHVNLTGGRYVSQTPLAAAKKMFSHAVRTLKACGKCTLTITLIETTQNSSNKTYVYKISKVPNPTEIERDGKTILYKFKTHAKSV